MEEKQLSYWKTCVNLLISILATIILIYVGIKSIFFFMPFVIGWLISVIASPLVKWLERRLKIVRKLGSAMIIIVVLGLIVLGVYLGSIKLWEIGVDFVESLPEYYVTLEADIEHAGENLDAIFDDMPLGVKSSVAAVADNFELYISEIITSLSEPTVSAASNAAKKIPSFLISLIVTIVAAYFFILDRENVIAWSKKVAPIAIQKRMELVVYNLKYAVGGYFKAQFKIMGVVCIILAISLGILGVKYAILVSVLIGMLDFLPFFGTGTAMIPWALFKILVGDYQTAIVLVIIYVVTQAVRQVIQPKLVADSIGMNPLLALVLLYIGYQFGGVLGMIVVIPVGLIIINLIKAGAFDYIINDVKIIIHGILKLRE